MSSNGLFCQVGLLKSLRAGSFEHRVEGLQGIAFKPIVDENPGLPFPSLIRAAPARRASLFTSFGLLLWRKGFDCLLGT